MHEKILKTALTIAGSDSSGGAGIQADIKTMTANGVYAMSAVTALTAQNTLGVRSVQEVSAQFLRDEIDAVFEDIRPDAVKIGMTSSKELIYVIAERLRFFRAENIVLDPVMISTSGSPLLHEGAVKALKEELFPLAMLLTPNLPEAEVLIGEKIISERDRERAAERLHEEFGCAVLLKGGHGEQSADDFLLTKEGGVWLRAEKLPNPNSHGTGCTLSSAIASNLAKGYPLSTSVQRAKEYVSGALSSGLNLGRGSGPLDHLFDLTGEFAKTTR